MPSTRFTDYARFMPFGHLATYFIAAYHYTAAISYLSSNSYHLSRSRIYRHFILTRSIEAAYYHHTQLRHIITTATSPGIQSITTMLNYLFTEYLRQLRQLLFH
jgi:hypothetical protein